MTEKTTMRNQLKSDIFEQLEAYAATRPSVENSRLKYEDLIPFEEDYLLKCISKLLKGSEVIDDEKLGLCIKTINELPDKPSGLFVFNEDYEWLFHLAMDNLHPTVELEYKDTLCVKVKFQGKTTEVEEVPSTTDINFVVLWVLANYGSRIIC